MKTLSHFLGESGRRCLAGVALLLLATLARADLPVIESIHVQDDHLTVTASVPPDIVRVVLELRDRPGGGAWVPVGVKDTDGVGGLIQFRVPRSDDFAMLHLLSGPDRLYSFEYVMRHNFRPSVADALQARYGGFSNSILEQPLNYR